MGMGSKRSQDVDVIGATDKSVSVGANPASATVQLEPGPPGDFVRAMGPIETGKEVTRLYLQLENVTGASPSAVIDVFVNLPAQNPPTDKSPYRADSLYLFGLDKASASDGAHAGNGLGFTIDITDLAQRLDVAGEFDPKALDVSIFPIAGSSGNQPIKVGRLSVLRRRVRAEE
jgi:tyrosinase